MDFHFSSEDLMLRDMLRRFVQREAHPLEKNFFTTGTLSPEEQAHIRQAIDQMGLWGAMVPKKFGGGLELVTTCLIEEELGKTFIPIELGDVSPLLYECAGEQVERFLNPALDGERNAIIAAREPGKLLPETWTSTAVPKDHAYSLNGCKLLGKIPTAVDFFILFAHAPAGLTAFLIDVNDVTSGITICGRPQLSLTDYPIGEEFVLGVEGSALNLGSAEAQRAWIRIGARHLGVVERLMDMAVAHAEEWVSHGAPLSARPAVMRLIAEMHLDLECARWLVYHAAWLADEGKAIALAASEVRLFTSEMLQRAAGRTTMIFSGPGQQVEAPRLVHLDSLGQVSRYAQEYARAGVWAELLNPKGVNADRGG